MKHISVLWLILVAPSLAWAGDTLKDARKVLLRGNYAEARECYETLLKSATTRAAAAIGISKSYQSEGEYEKALGVVNDTLKDLPKDADLLARRAEVLYVRGQWDEAEKAAKEALGVAEEHFLARWIVGQIYRDRGELDKADEEFRWFVRTYNQRSENGMEVTDPDTVLLIGLAGCERARYQNMSEQFKEIIKNFWGDALEQDKDFWWAAYESGQLFQEKYNKADANKAFDRALIINPRAALVLAAKGHAALKRFEMKDAESFAEQALQINPRLPEALRLRADVNLFSGDFKKAMDDLAKARDVNPRDEQTLARIAACFFLQKKDDTFKALTQEVTKHNPKAAVFYTELARRLEERRLYLDAEKFFQVAMEMQPKLPWAQNELGLLYMRLGKEDVARRVRPGIKNLSGKSRKLYKSRKPVASGDREFQLLGGIGPPME